MIILGIHDGHNASACLLVDGKIVAAVQEERFTRVKNQAGFPANAIEWVLSFGGYGPEDIDYIALAGESSVPQIQEEILSEYRNSSSLTANAKRLLKKTPLKGLVVERRKQRRLQDVRRAGLPAERASFVEHHLAHASAAYYGLADFARPILVLTCDGEGDYLCATVNIGESGKLRRIASIPHTESIGAIYAMTTFILGMVPLEHEYKLMGMAPYAPDEGSEKVFQLLDHLFYFPSENGLVWHRTNSCPETLYSYSFFKRLYELKRFDWICGGLQKFTERILVTWVQNCVRHTGIHNIALSGGVFMNVKANKAISEISEVESLFVFPSCGDESNAIGAAYQIYANMTKEMPAGIDTLYLGPEYDNNEIKRKFENVAGEKIVVKECVDIEAEVARLLNEGEIVARFKGRMEFGARALGNRSILADPSNQEVIRIINDMIKSRDFWMPFAPSILVERARDYLVNPKGIRSPYMMMAFDTTGGPKELRASLHPYDCTARPQVVEESHNPSYHYLLRCFEELTGRGAILNTSFNLHGYPIVSSPEDVLLVFEKSGLQFVAIENFLLQKSRTTRGE